MPLVKREINNALDYANYKLYEPAEGLVSRTVELKAMDKVSVAHMTGVLHQLGYLSSYATEMFNSLYQIAKITDQRMSRISGKLQAMQEHLPKWKARCALLHRCKQKGDYSQIYIEAAQADEQEFQRGPQLVQELFTPRTRDPTVLTTYQECLPPPRLASLDKYAAESLGKPGGPASCLEKYTNPKFFLNQWLAAERSRLVLEKRRRENRKESRRQRRDDRKRVRGAAARGGVAAAAAGVRQVHIKHKAAGVGASGRASVSGASYERRVTASNVQSDMVKTSSSSSASAVVPASSGRTASTTPSALAGIPSRQQQQHQQQQEAEQRRQVQLDHATMQKEALQQQRREDEERRRREEQVRVRQQQEQQQQQQEQTQPHLQQGAQEQQTQEPIRSTPPTPPPLPAMGVSSGPPVPPALPTAGLPGLPPPPTATGMRPVSMGKAATGARKNLLGSIQNFSKNKLKHTEAPTGGGGARAGGDARSNLMAAIRSGGKGLRHTEAPSTRNKPLDARSSLMSMIRSGGAKLKKTGGVNSAKAKRAAEMKKKRVSGGVAAILARRMAIVGSDSDDSDDDSDDDDDWD